MGLESVWEQRDEQLQPVNSALTDKTGLSAIQRMGA